jgi:hypothetical protein
VFHNEIVKRLSANDVANERSGAFAGPFTTRPVVEKREPWHGHTKFELSNPVIVHVSCVQTVVNALKFSCPVRATRNAPRELRTVAAPPTLANGDAESICTWTAVPLMLPFIVVSCGTLLGPEPPPPHADASVATAREDAAWQA